VKRQALGAILAAALFGATTPLAKLLLGEASPLVVGGLLYLGSGIGLGIARLVRDRGWERSGISRRGWLWLLGAIFFGGVLGPVTLLYGLIRTSASTTSLLLNLEAVLTAAIAWIAFRENANGRVLAGMLAIVAGGVVLSWPAGDAGAPNLLGPIAIAVACLCWAIDNNLTRNVSAGDALFIAAAKGGIAGTVNCVAALMLGLTFSSVLTSLATMALGLVGYGVSLVLYVVALRELGAARTGAYFATAPFIGAAMALAIFAEPATPAFWVAGVLMAVGVTLHLSERHEHEHTHAPLAHRHPHVHDEHHQHEHAVGWDGREPHEHVHEHAALTHKHPHFPDIHHRHRH
jgi:drug/metabolite transporter (DMT)-like permease